MGEQDIEKMEAEKDVDGLIKALKNEDGKVRKAAEEALDKIKTKRRWII